MSRLDQAPDESRRADGTAPSVSIVIANHDGGRFIEDALASATRQTLRDIEIIVVDDVSTDDSVALVEACAAQDPRISLIRMPHRSGPGGARNQGLLAARGTWVAILDSDDLMHPRRLAELIAIASTDSVEIIADNPLVFDHARIVAAHPLLAAHQLPPDRIIDAETYIRSNSFFSRSMPLGYLKPVFLRSFIESVACRYNPTLVIAEDFDFVLRLLLAGARFRVAEQMTYFYRRYPQSISHRLSAATLLPMLAADEALRIAGLASPDPLWSPITAALDHRRATIRQALEFEALIAAVKYRDWRTAVRMALRRPGVALLLRIPLRDRLRRIPRPRQAAIVPEPATRRVTLLSRQRIVGSANGSSAYLLSMCSRLKQAGYEIDFVSPSPATFGRWPLLRLDADMDLFASIRIRGSFRIGNVIFASDPLVALFAGGEILNRLLGRLHFRIERLGRKAPHAIAVPLTDADRLFVASTVRPSGMILTDYAFLNEAIPFALQPRTTSAVVMHDLFFSQDAARTVVLVDKEQEAILLDQADAVIAIQDDEAESVRQLLPGKRIILAPMAVYPVSEAQAGNDGTVLFVGSNTLPNIDGIGWFLDHVWPHLLQRFPDMRLQVAGSCCSGIGGTARNVTRLGRVADLAPHYRDAAVIVSPLRLGSGLKIKLVEALGLGKAVIATETTLQGVKQLVEGALLQADTPTEMLNAFARLLYDRSERAYFGSQALRVARQHFSTEACYRDLLEFARRAEDTPAFAPASWHPADPAPVERVAE